MKKLFSAATAAMMLLSGVQGTGFPQHLLMGMTVAAADVVDSGAWGANLKWSLDSDGVLTVTGKGDMPEISDTPLPWGSHKSSITAVILPEGLTSIARATFGGCSQLAEITFPSTITSIGDFSFPECTSLTAVTLPKGLLTLGQGAFYGCRNLASVTLPEGLTSIAPAAFYNCTSLTELTIPASVTEIGQESCGYAGSKIDGFTIQGETGSAAETYAKENGFVFTIAGGAENVVVASGDCGASGKNLAWKLDRKGLLTITGKGDMADWAYSYSVPWNELRKKIKEVSLPDGLTSLGAYAFADCVNLSEVTIPSGVTEIPTELFRNCSNLTAVSMPDGITTIGEEAFEGCNRLTELAIPSTVTTIEDEAFRGCNKLVSVNIPAGVTVINISVFDGCSSLTAISIPARVTQICTAAFKDCAGLTEITIPKGVKAIENKAFLGCSNLTSVTLPDGLKTIDVMAFDSCERLTSVTIPANVSIGDKAFGYYYGSDDTRKKVEGFTIYGQAGSSAEGYADENGFKFVARKASVVASGACGSEGRNLTWTLDSDGMLTIWGVGKMQPCTDASLVPWATYRANIRSVTLSDGMEDIAGFAFQGCSNLTTVNIPDKVTVIGESAFQDCEKLSAVALPENLTTIEKSAFEKCEKLSSIALPASVTTIAASAFQGCSGLIALNFPAEAIAIGEGAFSGCTGLSSLTIPAGMQMSGANAFSGCTGLTTLTIQDGVETLGVGAFSQCTGLTSVALPASFTTIPESAFLGCKALTTIDIPEGVTIIGGSAFSGCGLKAITIPASVTEIQEAALGYVGKQKVKGFTITGYAGSAAEKYAKANEFTFTEKVEVSDVPYDVNGDGTLDIADAVILARMVAESVDMDWQTISVAWVDVDEDGLLTIGDVRALLFELAKIPDAS